MNKYVIYSEHKTFKAFINGSFLKSARKKEKKFQFGPSVPFETPRQYESHSQDAKWHEQRGTNQQTDGKRGEVETKMT